MVSVIHQSFSVHLLCSIHVAPSIPLASTDLMGTEDSRQVLTCCAKLYRTPQCHINASEEVQINSNRSHRYWKARFWLEAVGVTHVQEPGTPVCQHALVLHTCRLAAQGAQVQLPLQLKAGHTTVNNLGLMYRLKCAKPGCFSCNCRCFLPLGQQQRCTEQLPSELCGQQVSWHYLPSAQLHHIGRADSHGALIEPACKPFRSFAVLAPACHPST